MMTSETCAALDAGALERRLDGDLAQLMGRQGRKRPVEGSDRRARGADDDDVVLHWKSPFVAGWTATTGARYRCTRNRSARRMTRTIDPSPDRGMPYGTRHVGLSIGRIAGLFCIDFTCARAATCSAFRPAGPAA